MRAAARCYDENINCEFPTGKRRGDHPLLGIVLCEYFRHRVPFFGRKLFSLFEPERRLSMNLHRAA